MQESLNAKLTTEQIIDKLASRFQPDQAEGLTVIYQFRLTDKFSFYIDINNQQCTTKREEHDDPNIVLTMHETTFIALMTGKIDGMSAFMKGDLQAHGNVLLATSLSKLFKKKSSDTKKIRD
jgi:putative sterol carrier protein